METPLSPLSASLAAALVVEGEVAHIPDEALTKARLSLLRAPNEDDLIDLAALQAKVERLLGPRGAGVSASIDKLLSAGVAALEATESHFDYGSTPAPGPPASARSSQRRVTAPRQHAPVTATPHLRHGIAKALRGPDEPEDDG